jgi:hypothetical protein
MTTIPVRIRTPTSTRPVPPMVEEPILSITSSLSFSSPEDLLSFFRDPYLFVMQRSLETDNMRRENREADIESKILPESERNGLCSICHSNYNSQLTITTACNHCFHSECLNEWVKYKPECPICRQEVKVRQL